MGRGRSHAPRRLGTPACEVVDASDDHTVLEGRERVHSLDAETIRLLWRHVYDSPCSISYAAGPTELLRMRTI